MSVQAVLFRRVAQHRHPRLDEGDAAVALDFRVFVAHQRADDVQRFAAGGAEHALLGVAQELLPARFVVVQLLPEFGLRQAEFVGGVCPARPAGAVFGGEEESVVQSLGNRCDHGGTLMVCECAFK